MIFENPELLNYKKNILETDNKLNDECFSVAINFHGIPLCLKFNSPNFKSEIIENYPIEWFTNNSTAQFNINIFEPPTDIEWDGESNPDCYKEKNLIIQRDFALKINDQENLTLHSHLHLDDGFYNFLRYFIPTKLPFQNKLLIHSGVFKGSKGAYIFLGHSGAGKSTTCTNLFEAGHGEVINDDMNIINFSDHTIVPAGMGGLFPLNKSHIEKPTPIIGIFWLEQAGENKLIKCSESYFIAKVIASAANLQWDELSDELREKIFSEIHKLIKKNKFGILKLKNSSSFWELIN